MDNAESIPAIAPVIDFLILDSSTRTTFYAAFTSVNLGRSPQFSSELGALRHSKQFEPGGSAESKFQRATNSIALRRQGCDEIEEDWG